MARMRMTASLGQGPSLAELVGQATAVLLNEFITNPRDPKWTEMAEKMDIQGGAPRDVVIARYVIDMAQGKTLSAVHLNHWRILISKLGEQELQNVIRFLTVRRDSGTAESMLLNDKVRHILERALVRYF